MNILRAIFRFFARLFSSPEKDETISLNASGPISSAIDSGVLAPDLFSVTALSSDGLTPVAGVNVRFRVIEGPIRLGSQSADDVVVSTDSDGVAALGATFPSIGTALVVGELPSDPGIAVYFEAHTEAMTDRIAIYSDPSFPVDPGIVTANIVALDHQNNPVSGANIVFEGAYASDYSLSGNVTEQGNGEYEGTFKTNEAGSWIILAQDMKTRVKTEVCVTLTPDDPHDIRIVGQDDPRGTPPYGEVTLRAELVDRFGNALDPHRLSGSADGQAIAVASIVGTEAHFPISFAGYGSVDVGLSDDKSGVSMDMTVQFAASWLEDPGLVLVGSEFRTDIYALPPPDRAAGHATIDIDFDSELVNFVRLDSPPREGPVFSTKVSADRNHLKISVQGEGDAVVTAEEFPNGVHIGTVVWECQGEGDCCFGLVAAMSPSTPKWEMCVTQKKADPQCLCVNIIHKSGNAAAKTAGTNSANQVPAIMSSDANVAICCPVLTVDIHYCAISAADWTAKVVPAIGSDQQVSSKAEMDLLYAANVCTRANCINMMMVNVNWGGFDGWTYWGTPFGGNRGFGVIEPGQESLPANGNLGAHEIGHALDLRHEGTPGDNLMSQYAPHGAKLTLEQCKTIWKNLGKYPC